MDIPNFRRGFELSSTELNKLSNAIRSAAVTSVIGGTFSRTPGGTTITVTPQVRGGSGEALQCQFRVSDASEVEGSILTLKVMVAQNPILSTISEAVPKGRYPQGMSGDAGAPNYVMEITQEAGFEYIYINLLTDQFGEILPGATSITVSNELELSYGNSTYQKFPAAIIEKRNDTESKPYIFKITNLCPLVNPRPVPTCPFLVEDDSRDGVCRITVRSGLVANTLPDDMTLVDTFSLVVSDTQSWFVVYCGMVVDGGVIQTGPGNITIFTDTQYEDSTDTYVYFKLAEFTVGYRADSSRYVDWVLNTCAVPFVAGGGATPCPYFKVTDATEGTVLKVEVAQNQIAGRWPNGMGLGFPAYKLDIGGNSYIYAKIVYNTTTLVIDSDSTAITVLQSDVLLPNTDSEVYILLATVLTTGDPPVISQINNVCTQPVPNPCLLAWSE